MDLDKICRAFKRNRFDCTIFETAEEAAAYLSQEIHDKTVGMGDSMTLENMKMFHPFFRCVIFVFNMLHVINFVIL